MVRSALVCFVAVFRSSFLVQFFCPLQLQHDAIFLLVTLKRILLFYYCLHFQDHEKTSCICCWLSSLHFNCNWIYHNTSVYSWDMLPTTTLLNSLSILTGERQGRLAEECTLLAYKWTSQSYFMNSFVMSLTNIALHSFNFNFVVMFANRRDSNGCSKENRSKRKDNLIVCNSCV
jgi:hypothetical protein